MAKQANQEIDDIAARLSLPFDIGDIEFVGKGSGQNIIAVPYVTNRAIQARLDEVMGINNWRNEFKPAPDGGVLCGIYLRLNGEWIVKWDGADNTRIEATKGGLSGSMKRAAVQWGIGRFLYDTPVIWVQAEQYTANGKIKSKLGNAGKAAARNKLKQWLDAFLRPYEPGVLIGKLSKIERESRYSPVEPSKTEIVMQHFEQAEIEALFGKMTNGAIIALAAWLGGASHYVNVEIDLLKSEIKKIEAGTDGKK